MFDNSEFSEFLNTIDSNRKEFIQSLFKEETIRKNQLLLAEGNICTKNYIIRNGVARKYFLHLDKEITTEIYLAGDIAFSFESFAYQKKSDENIIAVTDLECITINHTDYFNAKNKHPWFAEYDLMFVERYATQLEHKIKELATLDAAKRYEKILTHYPQLLQQVPLKIIATYLNVSAERLSRIRAKIKP